jgi:hypothetical protein
VFVFDVSDTEAETDEVVTKLLKACSQGTVADLPDDPTALRFENRGAVTSGIKECLRQICRPKHICDAL